MLVLDKYLYFSAISIYYKTVKEVKLIVNNLLTVKLFDKLKEKVIVCKVEVWNSTVNKFVEIVNLIIKPLKEFKVKNLVGL